MSEQTTGSLCQSCGINLAIHDDEHCAALLAQVKSERTDTDQQSAQEEVHSVQFLLVS